MIRYESTAQLTIEEFKTPFQTSLLADNRWVTLSKIVPWDKFASIYISKMNATFGRPSISPRVVLGAMIIKHIEKLDDRGVILAIQENPYMQFFVGLKEFSPQAIFDPSLFVEIRKRIGANVFDALNVEMIKSISEEEDQKHNKKQKDKDKLPPNKGKLQADATVADQHIAYPTDNGLLNECRKQCEKIIDLLYEKDPKKGVKPRTYRKVLDKAFLSYSKTKKKRKSAHRKMTRKLLECVNRNVNHINKMLDKWEADGKSFPLKHKEQQLFWVINTCYEQQKAMYDNNIHSHPHRIVSIFQPHVRAIPRGKTKAQVEFGSKLGVSLDHGFARIGTFSWDVYNEGGDLIKQVEPYRELHGYYPELVQVDKIYATRKNRKWLKDRGIRITASPLGRPVQKQHETAHQKWKKKKEAAERNHIEGKFGQGKNGYNLNKIRATLKKTSESWIACIFFIMNLLNLEKNFFSGPVLGYFYKSLLAIVIPLSIVDLKKVNILKIDKESLVLSIIRC